MSGPITQITPGTKRGGRQDEQTKTTQIIWSCATVKWPNYPDRPQHQEVGSAGRTDKNDPKNFVLCHG